jgi:hypothetical protein
VKSDRQGVGGESEKNKKVKNDWWEGKRNEKRFKKTKSRMLISQQHVYDRVWARGHASTG